MKDDTPHILFERTTRATLFRALNPGYAGLVLSLDELVPAPEGDAPERLAFLKGHLPEEASAQAEDFLAALEELRAAPLAGAEDLDFAFSLMPESPKNRALKSLLRFYLGSPLAEDRTARLMSLAESWRRGEPAPAAGSWRVIPDSARPEGLVDLTRALQAAEGVVEARTADPWSVALLEEGKHRSVNFPFTVPRSLETVALLAARAEKSVVLFQGSEAERAWLTFSLAAKGLRVHDWLAPPEPAHTLGISAGSVYLTSLRKSAELPLSEILRLNHLLCENGAPLWDEPTWNRSIARLAETKSLKEAELAFLKGLSTPSDTSLAPKDRRGEARVSLLPFPGVSLPAALPVFIHVNKNAMPRPESSSLIREAEREGLAAAGFYLPRASMLRAEGRSAWEFWGKPAPTRRWLFGAESVSSPHRAFRLPRSPEPPPVVETPLPVERDKPLSATQIETYARCPARYWFGHRLKLRRTDRDGAGYPLVLGQVVHKALETSFTASPEIPDETTWKDALPAAFTMALAEEAPEVAPTSRLAAELRGPFLDLLAEVPRLEREMRAALGNRFTPFAFEKDFTLELDGVRLRGKIDRIDRSPEGDLLILDYKTGLVDFSPGQISQGKSFQALIYLIAAQKMFGRAPVGMLFYDLKGGEIRRGILHEEAFPPETKKAITRGHVLNEAAFEAIGEAGWAQLKQIAERIDRGEFAATPTSDNCGRCDYVALCREAVGFA